MVRRDFAHEIRLNAPLVETLVCSRVVCFQLLEGLGGHVLRGRPHEIPRRVATAALEAENPSGVSRHLGYNVGCLHIAQVFGDRFAPVRSRNEPARMEGTWHLDRGSRVARRYYHLTVLRQTAAAHGRRTIWATQPTQQRLVFHTHEAHGSRCIGCSGCGGWLISI